jgi:hypothetical protein
MPNRRQHQGGNAVIEFTLVGIPMMFVLISIFEMSRGMWMYQTLSAGVKAASRYSIVHGRNCDIAPNACPSTVQSVATALRNNGPGLLPEEVMVTLSTVTAGGAPTGGTQISSTSLQTLLTDTRRWPDSPGNDPGMMVSITATVPFRSALAFFWPGSGGFTFGAILLGSSTAEAIQF